MLRRCWQVICLAILICVVALPASGSRTFNGTSQFLQDVSTPISAAPLSMSAWFNVDDVASIDNFLVLSDRSTSLEDCVRLLTRGDVGGDPIEIRMIDGASPIDFARTSTGYSATTWQHAGGTWSASQLQAFLNGANKGTDSSLASTFPAGLSHVTIGAQSQNNAESQYLGGSLAEIGLWSVELTDDELASTADGFSPLMINPKSLVAYWPLGGIYGENDKDIVGGFNMTPTASPTFSPHQEEMIYPMGMAQ